MTARQDIKQSEQVNGNGYYGKRDAYKRPLLPRPMYMFYYAKP